jgi:hypothetical protein
LNYKNLINENIFFDSINTARLRLFSQSPAETDVLKISSKVFQWEVESKIASLNSVFDEKFVAFTSSGDHQIKKQYLAGMQSGKVIHNSIDIEENIATVTDNTATVGGKGRFIVT